MNSPEKHQNRVELLTIEHTFWIHRNALQMLILHPDFAVPDGWDKRGWSERTERVLVVTPERESEATAQNNMTHLNIRDPNVPPNALWRITMWLTDRTEAEVPIGSKIYVSPEIRDAILPPGHP